ncbi:hypothetical protein DY000_02040623 [Brassica cretica]|uniref:Uncharacterized protein n=1 Tax=Brassica cretica TaxID=69181 RepID=A0ABQ7BQ92_BRACR|nr:hypothetical protein DY000_02040623 [Brassica cretica]
MGISFSSLMTRIRRSTASSPLVVDIMKAQFINVSGSEQSYSRELKRSTRPLPMKSHGTELPRLLLKHQHIDQVKEHMVRSKPLVVFA